MLVWPSLPDMAPMDVFQTRSQHGLNAYQTPDLLLEGLPLRRYTGSESHSTEALYTLVEEMNLEFFSSVAIINNQSGEFRSVGIAHLVVACDSYVYTLTERLLWVKLRSVISA